MTHDSTDYTTPSDDFVRGIDIHTLLPQREPYVAVGRLTHFDIQTTVTETVFSDAPPFVEQGVMNDMALVENAAQTCAAHIGYINRYILHRDIAAGVVAAIDRLDIERHPPAGATLTTTAVMETELCGMILVRVTTECSGRTVMTARMKLVV